MGSPLLTQRVCHKLKPIKIKFLPTKEPVM
jgi:hypothetical protein